MMLSATFQDTSGSPLVGKAVSVVRLESDGTTVSVVDGTTDDLGAVSLDAGDSLGVSLALLIGGTPLLTAAQSITADGTLALGTLVVSDRPLLPLTAFHTASTGGYVYGCPTELYSYVKSLIDAASTGGGDGTTGSGDDTTEEDPAMDSVLTAISTAISKASSDTSGRATTSGYTLSSVRVNAKCLLSSADGSVSLGFLDKTEIASVDPDHLSEVEVAYVAPRGTASTGTSTVDSAVPALTGYTRELAVRKVRAAGMVPELNSVVVTSAAQVGRVVSQSPAAGEAPASDTVVKLYLGILRS